MGYLTRKPDSNDLPEPTDHPWADENEIMDITALCLNGLVVRCLRCNRWTRKSYISNGLCPDCVNLSEIVVKL